MNKKFLKVFTTVLCSMGVVGAIPFVGTSCSKPKHKLYIEDGYSLADIHRVKGLDFDWSCDLPKHIVDETGSHITDYEDLHIHFSGLPSGVSAEIDKGQGSIHLSGVVNAESSGKITMQVNYLEGSTTASISVNFVVAGEVDFPLDWLKVDTNGELSLNPEYEYDAVQKKFAQVNTLYIPEKIGDTVIKSIKDNAFCPLIDSTPKALIINTKLTLKFDENSKVEKIGNQAFRYCTGIQAVVLPNSLKNIGDTGEDPKGKTFIGCSGLTSVRLSEQVVTINSMTFAMCANLVSIIIPDSVTTIDASAFYNDTRLSNVVIGKGVTTIKGNAFRGCTLTNVTISPENAKIGLTTNLGEGKVVLDKDSDGNVKDYAGDTAAGSGHTNVPGSLAYGDITFPSTVQYLPDCDRPTHSSNFSFTGCAGITSLSFPKELKKIGAFSFYACPNIKKIVYLGTAEEFKAITLEDYWIGGEGLPNKGTVYAPILDDANAILDYLKQKYPDQGFDNWTTGAVNI